MTTELSIFDELKAAVTQFVAPVKQITVTNADSNLVAAQHLKTLKGMQKTLEARRKEFTAPLLEKKRSIDSYCDEINAPLIEAEMRIKDAQRGFAMAEQKRIEDERKKIEAERRAAEEKERQERARIESEAQAKRDAEAKAIRDEQERQRLELEEKQARDRERMKKFGVDPEAEKKAAAEAAQKLAAEQESARIARERQHQADVLADQARFNREEKERQDEAKRKMKALEAERPKNLTTRKTWRLVDIKLLPSDCLLPNTVEIQKRRNAETPVPGIEFTTTTDVVARG